MEQSYWEGIHDSLADGIQFVENHAGLTESTERSPQRPAKKKARFFRVLDTQIWIPIPQPHPPTSPPPPPGHHPPPSTTVLILVFDSPLRSLSPSPEPQGHRPLSPVTASTLVFNSPSRSAPLAPPGHHPPSPSPTSTPLPLTVAGDSQYESYENFMFPPQAIHHIQVILITSIYQLNLKFV